MIAEIIIFTLILVLAGTTVLYWRHKSALSNDGIDRLCKELQMLKSASVPEHIHLSTPEWAGDGLDSAPTEPGYIRVNQLRIVKAKE